MANFTVTIDVADFVSNGVAPRLAFVTFSRLTVDATTGEIVTTAPKSVRVTQTPATVVLEQSVTYKVRGDGIAGVGTFYASATANCSLADFRDDHQVDPITQLPVDQVMTVGEAIAAAQAAAAADATAKDAAQAVQVAATYVTYDGEDLLLDGDVIPISGSDVSVVDNGDGTFSLVNVDDGVPGGGGGAVSSVAGRIGDVSLTRADVGLGNVDNTSDATKPVSTAQAAAIALKAEPRPNTICLLGDSITAAVGPSSSAPAVFYGSRGFFTWANRYLGQRLTILNNGGVVSDTSAQILARFDAAVGAYNPGYVFILAGTNDGTDPNVTIANLTAMHTKILALGAIGIFGTIPPVNTAGTAKATANAVVNQWIKRQADLRPSWVVVDWTATLQGSTGGTWGTSPAVSADGIHPNALGAQRMGRVAARVLDPIIPRVDRAISNADDAACLTANPMMFGTGGSIDTGGTGTVAAEWTAGQVTSGATFTIAQVPCTDMPGLNWHELTVTAVGSGGACLKQFTTGSSVAARTTAAVGNGSYYVATCEYELDSLSGPVLVADYGPGLSLKVQGWVSNYSTVTVNAFDMYNATDNFPVDGALEKSGVLRTAPTLIPAGTANLVVSVSLTAVGKVRIRRLDLRKVL